jgi:hypothetical protein
MRKYRTSDVLTALLKIDLTKENFVNICNIVLLDAMCIDNSDGLDINSNETVDINKISMLTSNKLKEKVEYLQNELSKSIKLVSEFTSKHSNDKKIEYFDSVNQVQLKNETIINEFKESKVKVQKIKEWSVHFPKLCNVFDEMIQPNLYLEPILAYSEWVAKVENERKSEVTKFEKLIKEAKVAEEKYDIVIKEYLNDLAKFE